MLRIDKANNTKQKIITSATALFFQKGFENTTMQEIMNTTGLSKGALYHHFISKQEILESIIIQSKEDIIDFFEHLILKDELNSIEKIDLLVRKLQTDHALLNLTQNHWAEKVPYALLNTLRNSINILSKYVEEIIRQGNVSMEFNCQYPKEVSEIFILLFDVWLDPIIVNSTYPEACNRIQFIVTLLQKFEAPLISETSEKMIKERLKEYYDK
ncbi:TetR/AcrR family transcriptional regulator [Lacrimispora sp.]|jgi:AcrR family transcriptional regulator|uniref:TetR/AcrR family transcriptional regulator n=1 Tax=Lacrimispora sp. TaxID=2719234 RepID=UPI0028A889D0|nr:TetR/AcrR family transcriptional regulator [Lacrimispora sp.]